jgi:hypothetical protein
MPRRTRVTSPEVAEPAPGLWSNCIRVGDVVHVAGMTSRGADVRSQAPQVVVAAGTPELTPTPVRSRARSDRRGL